jgi:O-antigen/teichoic acid export membrane protein
MEISQKSKKRNIKGGIILSYVYFAFSMVLSLYFDRYVLKNLGDIQYGLNSFVASITSWLSLLTFGLSSTYVRFATIAEKEEGEMGVRKTNGFYFVFVTVASVLAAIIGGVICVLFFTNTINLTQYTSQQKTWINLLLVISIISTIISFLANFLSAYGSYKVQFIWLRSLDIFTKIGTVVFSVIAIKKGGDIVTAAIVAASVQLAIGIANFCYCFFVIRLRINFGTKEYFKKQFRTIFSFSFFVFLNIIMNEINTALGKTVLGVLDNATSVAIFNIALIFYTYSNQLTSAISTSYVPEVNSLVVNGQHEEVDKLFVRVSIEQALVMLLILGGFIACGKSFIMAWVGESKIPAYYIGVAFLFAASVPFSQNLGIEVQRAYNKQKFRSIFYTGMAILNAIITILAVYFLPSNLKVYGAALGTIVSLLIGTWIAINIYYKKGLHLSIGRYWKNYLILLVISLTIALFVEGFFELVDLSSLNPWLIFIIRGFSFTALYFCAIALVYHSYFSQFITKIKNKFLSFKK